MNVNSAKFLIGKCSGYEYVSNKDKTSFGLANYGMKQVWRGTVTYKCNLNTSEMPDSRPSCAANKLNLIIVSNKDRLDSRFQIL